MLAGTPWDFPHRPRAALEPLVGDLSPPCPPNNFLPLPLRRDDVLPPGPHNRGGGAGREGGVLPGAGRPHHPLTALGTLGPMLRLVAADPSPGRGSVRWGCAAGSFTRLLLRPDLP